MVRADVPPGTYTDPHRSPVRRHEYVHHSAAAHRPRLRIFVRLRQVSAGGGGDSGGAGPAEAADVAELDPFLGLLARGHLVVGAALALTVVAGLERPRAGHRPVRSGPRRAPDGKGLVGAVGNGATVRPTSGRNCSAGRGFPEGPSTRMDRSPWLLLIEGRAVNCRKRHGVADFLDTLAIRVGLLGRSTVRGG